MTFDALDRANLAQLVASGVLRVTQIVGQQGGWRVMVNYGRTEQALATQRGRIRIFPTLEKVVDYLAEAGITNFDVDASHNPNNSARTKRPVHNAGVGDNITKRPTIECTEELKGQIQKAINEIETLCGTKTENRRHDLLANALNSKLKNS